MGQLGWAMYPTGEFNGPVTDGANVDRPTAQRRIIAEHFKHSGLQLCFAGAVRLAQNIFVGMLAIRSISGIPGGHARREMIVVRVVVLVDPPPTLRVSDPRLQPVKSTGFLGEEYAERQPSDRAQGNEHEHTVALLTATAET